MPVDPLGLLPPVIRHNAEREQMVDAQMGAAFALHAALQDIDPRLDLVFVTDRADPEYGVVPGRWHVVRYNDAPAPDSYMAITTPDGGYREPDSGVIHELHARDLWRTGIPEPDLKPAALREQKAKDSEAIKEELAHDLRAGARVAGEGGLTKRRWGRK